MHTHTHLTHTNSTHAHTHKAKNTYTKQANSMNKQKNKCTHRTNANRIRKYIYTVYKNERINAYMHAHMKACA